MDLKKAVCEMDEKDKIIVSLRKQLQEANSKTTAVEQENALLNFELEKYRKIDRNKGEE